MGHVGLQRYRTIEVLGYKCVRLQRCWTIEVSDYRGAGL